MKIIASITGVEQAPAAERQGADLIELRFDLIEGDPVAQVKRCKKLTNLPMIATLRSADEGGRYSGNADEWLDRIKPTLPFVDYIDIEQKYSAHAASIRSQEKTVIASYHTNEMPTLFALFGLERELRVYGDIVKIVVAPKSEDDVIELISFTNAARKPLCTSIMGGRFRFVRLILPLFGSEYVYCHAGVPTAEGQYSVQEARQAIGLFSEMLEK